MSTPPPPSSILHPRLSPGAQVIVSGTADPDVDAAVSRARDRLGITAPIERIDWNAVTWTHEPTVEAPTAPGGSAAINELTAAARSSATNHPPLAPPAPSPSVALSVVVVFYNMRREAARTLQSLSRSYQRDVQDLDYEVLVIDNGSDADQRLSEEFVSAFGPEFRLLEPDGDPQPSPTAALNAGIAASRGDALGLMIDGAHVLTPGVLHFGMKALRIYEPAVVATQQWYVGPGQQGDAQQAGYDQRVEDRLFDVHRMARGRLSPVRDRALHRRARLVRRHHREQLPVRAPQAPGAGRRLRRELLDARGRLRQPRPVRAARPGAGRDAVEHPG